MRLIDAEKLPRHGGRGGIVHWTDIEKAPTVEAIPIEWIVEYKDKYSNISSEDADVIKAETLVDMLADWAERKGHE